MSDNSFQTFTAANMPSDGSSLTVYEVVLQCIGSGTSGETGRAQRQMQMRQFARLRFFGGNRDRPYWVTCDKPETPIENQSWMVTHFRLLGDLPESLPVKD